MSRRLVCVSCAERAATGNARVAGGAWQPVCSEACAQQMIGMPKRAADDDDAAQDAGGSPAERFARTINNLLRLARMLERIVKLETYVNAAVSLDANSRRNLLTYLEAPLLIGSPIMTKDEVAGKLCAIRSIIVDAIVGAQLGSIVDFASINADIAKLLNNLADDTTIERYLATVAPTAWTSLLPFDIQRAVAQRTFPIQVVAKFRLRELRGVMDTFRARPNDLVLLYNDTSYTFIAGCAVDGNNNSVHHSVYGYSPLQPEEVESFKVLDTDNKFAFDYNYFMRGFPENNAFAIDNGDSTVWYMSDSTPATIIVHNPYTGRETKRFTNNAASRLYDIIANNQLYMHTSLCAARNNTVVVADQTGRAVVVDLANDTVRFITDPDDGDAIRGISSITLDDALRVWIATVTATGDAGIRVYAPTGNRIANDTINALVPRAQRDYYTHFRRPRLSAMESIVWFGYTTPNLKPAFIALRMAPLIAL